MLKPFEYINSTRFTNFALYTPKMSIFRDIFIKLIKENAITTKELAVILNRSPKQIKRIREGRAMVKDTHLSKLLKHLGYSIVIIKYPVKN